ncbi:G-type lectin S-receptor-like serine/threonine-protein kinase [Abeliophyllum distichum]|uniref:Receptor-like serine/threonine-protein kinase n=1 Tax=Abeliophyllum distichum TaxID=126358 RepID=A0ABD1S9Z5_9LAMI
MKIPFMQMFCLIFIFFPTLILAADVFPGTTLYASNLENSWDSANKTFSLSFIKEAENIYFAAIIYTGIPVWKAGGDPGGAVNSSAALRFLPDGNLQLVYAPTGSLVWQSNTAGRGVSTATLDDTGNFILKNGSNIPIWTTFDNPTDTILPGQNFTVNNVLRSGLYSFRLLTSGNMTLRWNDSIVYYSSSGINSSSTNMNLTSPSLGLQQPVGIFSLFDPTISSPLIMARSNDYGEVTADSIRFVKLENDGNLRMYSSAKNSGSGNKIVRWTAVSDQCEVFGYCGNMGICSYKDLNPVCGCASENFDPVDPKDPRKGCKRKMEIKDCSNRGMLLLDRATFLTYPPETSSQYYTAGFTGCRSNCLSDNSCMGSTSFADGTGVCYMKLSDFISGYQSPTLTSTSFVKVCEPAMPNRPLSSREDHKNYNAMKISVVVLGCCLILVISAGVFWVFFCNRKHNFKGLPTWDSLSEYASALPVHFSYKELQQATEGFKEKLGEGGFGAVYRGVLTNKTLAAVKQLEGIEQGEKQFRMETSSRVRKFETWGYRYNIALGTAKGITYLHEECRDCIVHSDIKPENILLDDNYNARISDFGLARLINTNGQRHRSIQSVRGTRGYLPPEWLANLPVTSKADVYSYGMVLLEIISGRRNFEVSTETNHKKLSLWAYEEFEKGNIEVILDKRLPRDEVDTEQVIRAIQVSFWCIQEQPSHRPTMGKVVQMLEGISEIRAPPPSTAIKSTSANAQFQVLPMVSSFQTVFNSSQTAANSSLASEQKSEGETSILLEE